MKAKEYYEKYFKNIDIKDNEARTASQVDCMKEFIHDFSEISRKRAVKNNSFPAFRSVIKEFHLKWKALSRMTSCIHENLFIDYLFDVSTEDLERAGIKRNEF